jgi:predicted transcriptional regulator
VLVKDVMRREVAVISPEAWLVLAACMMRAYDVGCLPVIENGRLIGMITDRDIVVRGVAEGLNLHHAVVREAIRRTPSRARPSIRLSTPASSWRRT